MSEATSFQAANVACSVEIYPFEGGPYYISGGQIKAVTVTKTLHGGADGNFGIELAPGGPFGPESPADWSQIITPGSHVLIGMGRGADSAIVMDGVVTLTAEDQQWHTDENGSSSAMRIPTITGSDFAWFFNTQNWYSLQLLGLTLGTGIGNQIGAITPPSLIQTISQGLNGTPVQIGQYWFNVMCGPSGMLTNTFVPYQGGYTRIPFSTLIGQNYEQYLAFIPFSEQFLGLESWNSKFMNIFPWPWYEFFVTTAPSGTYNFIAPDSGTPANIAVSGRVFTMRDFPSAAPAGPQMVARIVPIPRMDFVKDSATQNIAPTSSIDTSRWTNLPLNELSGYGFYESRVEFASDEVKNFYLLNPTAYPTLFGNNGTNVVPFPFVFMAAADPASIHRYGYRPVDGTFRWFFDWEGKASQNQNVDIVQSVATTTAALASWWHPLPLMLRGQVAIPLAPSIYIGTRYRYAPFKDGTIWEFYVEGVSHRFVFGGQSMTTLTLTRGLPVSVYSDTAASGLLHAVYTGNARRQYTPGSSGIYQIGLPQGTGQGLQVFSTPQNAAAIAGQMSQTFVTPQAPTS